MMMTCLYSILASPFTLILCIISLLFLFRKKIIGMIAKSFIEAIHIEQKKRRPKRIILVRHGNSEANNNYDILQHTPDNKITLTKKGEEIYHTIVGDWEKFVTDIENIYTKTSNIGNILSKVVLMPPAVILDVITSPIQFIVFVHNTLNGKSHLKIYPYP